MGLRLFVGVIVLAAIFRSNLFPDSMGLRLQGLIQELGFVVRTCSQTLWGETETTKASLLSVERHAGRVAGQTPQGR